MDKRISGHTKMLCLIGSPVGHSGSPAMYNFSFQNKGQDMAYLCFDIKEDQVPQALDALRLFNVVGFNVTMPCKNAVARYVDELAPAAKIIGAVNTVINDNGKLIGHITDGQGFVLNLKENGVDVKGKKIVVFGAGGAATAIQVECALQGAASITVFNGNDPFLERARGTKAKLATETPDVVFEVYSLDETDKMREAIAEADILANATSVGMAPNVDATPMKDTSFFRPDLVVADAVYNPIETRFMREAKEAGVKKVLGGSGMLLWQGAAAYKLYTGEDMPVDEYRQFQKENQ